MVEVNEKFVNGRFVGNVPTSASSMLGGELTIMQDADEIEREMRGLPSIDEAIKDDISKLKADDDCCACSTAIGMPRASIKPAKQRVFDSGLKVIQTHTEKVKVNIPREILNICDDLQVHVGRNEFSIVCKGEWGDDGNYVIGSEYKVPKQKVEGAAVDYDLVHLEELKREGYNAVIHSHPFQSSSFSSSDQETINSHFECSVLYSIRDFTTATIAIIPKTGTKLIVKGDPCVEGRTNVVPKSELDNIEQKSTKYNDDIWYGGVNQNFRTAGKQAHFGCQGRHSHAVADDNHRALTRRVTTHFGNNTYTWDPEFDVFYDKFGNVIEDPFYKRSRFQERPGQKPVRVAGGQVEVRQIPSQGMIRVDNSSRVLDNNRVFHTQDQTRVFRTETDVEHKNGKKSKGGKKDNQPKIYLSP